MIDLNKYPDQDKHASKDRSAVDPITAFVDAIHAAGIAFDGKVIANGKIQRFSPDGRSDRSGWYWLTLDTEFAYGVFGDWSTADGKHKWCSIDEHKLNPAQVARRKEHDAEIQRQKEDLARKTAIECRKIWDDSAPAPADFPYLVKKGVGPHGIRVHNDGYLLIPMRDNMGDIHSLQRIWPDGEKKNWAGGDPKGHYFTIPGEPQRLYLCEGYATGASIHDATGGTVIVAFTADNLYPVAQGIKSKHPTAAVTVCADNDQWKPDKGNTGIDRASRVGKKYGWKIVWPEFLGFTPTEPGKGPTDFNDLAAQEGLDAVKLKILGPPRSSLFDMVLSEDEFMAEHIPPRKTYLVPWVQEQCIIMIYAPTGVGKSWFAVGVVNALTRGERFGVWECVEPVPCLYLDGELPADDFKSRLMYFRSDTPRKAPLYILSNALMVSKGMPIVNLIDPEWRAKLKEMLLSKGIKVWVVDNIASLTPGMEENDKAAWDPINAWFMDLRFSGITTIFIHHAGKSGQQRGTSGRVDNIDVNIELTRPASYMPEEGCRFVCHFEKQRLPQKLLSLIIDTDFRLIEDENGRYTWAYSNVKTEVKKDVLRLLADGYSMGDIAVRLRIGKTTVARHKKDAIKDGLIIENGLLTPDGKAYLNENHNQ